jgi:hypothetical protein
MESSGFMPTSGAIAQVGPSSRPGYWTGTAAPVDSPEPSMETPELACPRCGGPADLDNLYGRCADCEAAS